MKIKEFEKKLFNEKHHIILIETKNIQNNDYLIGLFVNIRYLVFFYKIKDLSISEIKKDIQNKKQNLPYKEKIKIICSDKDKMVNELKDILDNDLYDSTFKNSLTANVKIISNLIIKEGIHFENVKKTFNQKNKKPLLKKTPNFWLDRLNETYKLEKGIKNLEQNTKGTVDNPDIIYLPSKDKYKNNLEPVNNFVNNFKFSNEKELYDYITTKHKKSFYDFFIYLKGSFDKQIIYLRAINSKFETLYNVNYDNNKQLKIINEQLKSSNDDLSKKYSDLLDINKELEKKLSFVQEEIKIQQKVRLEKEEKKNKKKQAKKLPKRDYIEFSEFQYLLTLCDSNSMFDNRKKCAFILLYLTGLRVSNLLNFKIKHIKQLIYNGTTRVDLIKNGELQHLISLSKKSKEFIDLHHDSFHALFKYKDDEDFFFTSFSNSEKSLNRSNFNTELNTVLKKISDKFNKNIKTHSFRTTYITDLLETTPLHFVKDIIGHKVVASTEIYYRSTLNYDKSMKILNKADLVRFK